MAVRALPCSVFFLLSLRCRSDFPQVMNASLEQATTAEIATEIAVPGTCRAKHKGFPIQAVQYVPHLVGEPYPHPESDPASYYSGIYNSLHKRDLALMGNMLQADTLRIRPWPVDVSSRDSRNHAFLEQMQAEGVCKLIPTFHLSKFYAEMLKQRMSAPETDSSSALSRDFVRFGGTMEPEMLGGVELVAWSVDVSLNLKHLLPLVQSDCLIEPKDESYVKYKSLLELVVTWVRQHSSAGSVAPALRKVPLLVPLDLSQIDWTQLAVEEKLNTLLGCMSTWSRLAFGNFDDIPRARWLLSFALPYGTESSQGEAPSAVPGANGTEYSQEYPFERLLLRLSKSLERSGMSAVIMVGTQALKPDPLNDANPVQDYGNSTAPPHQQLILRKAFETYQRVNATSGNLDGFILDEWQDDWDRGSRGPFFLADDTLEDMRGQCALGGRFSHDVGRCTRPVGWGHIYPEFFGQASTTSAFLKHCAGPRFREDYFSYNYNLSMAMQASGKLAVQCEYLQPNLVWVWGALGLLGLVGLIQILKTTFRECCNSRSTDADEEEEHPSDERPLTAGVVSITPKLGRLRSNHTIVLQSTRLRSNAEAGWWLWSHLQVQMAILEKQVEAEAATWRALRMRAKHRTGESFSTTCSETSSVSSGSISGSEFGDDDSVTDMLEGQDDIEAAMATVHRRALEGVAAWCGYIAKGICMPAGIDRASLKAIERSIDENQHRPLPKLFAEALLLRIMESLGEQILNCPERLALLYYHSVRTAVEAVANEAAPISYQLNLEELQDGLAQMDFHSNPYERKKMPNGSRELGLNFDDINESGIQCRQGIAKTFKEPRSAMVIVDFIICYRVPFILKSWTFLFAVYIYLGTGLGNDLTTSFNGTWFQPKWLRVNFIQYAAAADAVAWIILEVMNLLYTSWQRGPSFCQRSPGVPGRLWLLEHLMNLVFSYAGLSMVWGHSKFLRKPFACRQSDVGECADPRSKTSADTWDTLCWACIYWMSRFVVFCLMHRRAKPIFIHGTPWQTVRKAAGRGCWDKARADATVNAAWILMLLTSIAIEVIIILPSMKGLDWITACGFDVLGDVPGIPAQVGTCSEQENWLEFGCVTCVASILCALALVFLGAMVDIYFVFYIFAAVVGSIMGHSRQLNDLKNISLPIDLRPGVGREARLFKETFGPGWQEVWREMVQGLLDESLISPRMGKWLTEAAGITLDGQTMLTRRDKKSLPIHLTRYPRLAAERLAFFFQSLNWIEAPHSAGQRMRFRPETDALTATNFDPGTVPSLTQIIPAYNEVVIPSVEFLRAGALPEDAMNQSPDDQHGVGDLTGPPLGDGVNTNLAFIISQFPDEWIFLAKRLHQQGHLEEPNAHDLFKRFMRRHLREDLVVEVRIWAAMRTQSVAKTVIGALQYERALAFLPKMKQYYARFPEKRSPEDHAELILSHQNYGMKPPEGTPENDESVRLLMSRYANDSLVLVFDLAPTSSLETWHFVEAFLTRRGGYELGAITYASVKCRWDAAIQGLRVLEVLPRKFPLRLGQGDYRTQGKACNQLNALRFASGHYVQALDCNMGVFIGEGFKVPYVLRVFMPLDKRDRVATQCRYLGFREHIYTGREGTVGKCHASAEWTFGTIYQRFLSGMGTRMHYGHPDFVDGFWARNRGGMSKSSPVVNLSEDIFAGYNVHMRGEASPHVDALEFEKGREATFNAASSFFSKISGGSVAVVRSRDNHLLCERTGILHSLSFYFTSVAFYVSNLLIDMSISLYVMLFIVFTLANIDLAKLTTLGSSFSTEWLLSMGIMSLFPQFFELVLEFGAVRACKDVFGGLLASTLFFIFQNKNISAAMRDGVGSGLAKYFFTGRPMANQHQTWKDMYGLYWKSHYSPALRLMTSYLVYNVLVSQTFQGRLPMFLVVVSFTSWIITPIVFSPFPRFSLIEQDLREFLSFINGRAGTAEEDILEVVDRGRRGRARTIFECGLADAISYWRDMPMIVLLFRLLGRAATCVFLALALPAEIMDFLWIYLVVLSLQWVLLLGFFIFDHNNILLVVSLVLWVVVMPFGEQVIGSRADSPSMWARFPEYLISFLVFLEYLGCAEHIVLVSIRAIFLVLTCCCCIAEEDATLWLYQSVRFVHVYFFGHQIHKLQAYMVLLSNTIVSLFLLLLDKAFCNVHTWWLLNEELARTGRREQYLENRPTLLEQESQRYGHTSETSSNRGEQSDISASSDQGASSGELHSSRVHHSGIGGPHRGVTSGSMWSN